MLELSCYFIIVSLFIILLKFELKLKKFVDAKLRKKKRIIIMHYCVRIAILKLYTSIIVVMFSKNIKNKIYSNDKKYIVKEYNT